jgi:hypothetical protein
MKAIRSTSWKNLGSKYTNPNPNPKKCVDRKKKNEFSDPQHCLELTANWATER